MKKGIYSSWLLVVPNADPNQLGIFEDFLNFKKSLESKMFLGICQEHYISQRHYCGPSSSHWKEESRGSSLWKENEISHWSGQIWAWMNFWTILPLVLTWAPPWRRMQPLFFYCRRAGIMLLLLLMFKKWNLCPI